MSGTWKLMPTACSSSYFGAIRQCAQWAYTQITACKKWADEGSYQCAQWADEGSYQCSKWADEGYNACSSWGSQCNWYTFWNCVIEWFCYAWYWIANLVCQAWYWLANLVCQAWYWVAKFVCLVFITIIEGFCIAWRWILHWFCTSDFDGGTMLLLTDGTVIINECSGGYGTHHWWKLTPDINGSYLTGMWTRIAQSNYGRKYFASAVLANGKVIVCGGEYSDVSGANQNDDTNKCEIYDPIADTWTAIARPPAINNIGDSPCCVLPDGRFLLGNYNSTAYSIFDPINSTWTTTTTTVSTKNDSGSEETWVLMPDNTIISPECTNHPNSERYNISAGNWQNTNSLPVDLVEPSSIEIGPGILLPTGKAFFTGAVSSTAIYTMPVISTNPGTWSVGPVIPNNLGSKDGPACLMTNGNVLVPFAPVDGVAGNYLPPCTFFEFDGNNLNQVTDPPTANCPTYVGRMMLLPTGEIMFAREDSSKIYAYEYAQSPHDPWRPVITACPSTIFTGTTIQVSGQQFSGLSQAVGYGDDSAAATNYPLVRIMNIATGHIRYCRTHDHTTLDSSGNTIPSMGVSTGLGLSGLTITTQVAIPSDIETGPSVLFVVANGIPSVKVVVTIKNG